MELCVADPSSATQEITKNTFQNILTKFSSSSKVLSHQEMCSRLLKNMDNDRRAIRFLMKQFVFESSQQGHRSGSMAKAFEQLKQEMTQLKQSSSSQRIELEQTIADLQHRNQALQGTVDELQRSVKDKEQQVSRFRGMYASDGMTRVPSSSYSDSSGGKRNRSSQPPMQEFLAQRDARERAKQQAYSDMGRARRPSTEPAITPIQYRPASTGSGTSSLGPPTPRIRESASGYVFSSRHRDKRPRNSPGTGASYGARKYSRGY